MKKRLFALTLSLLMLIPMLIACKKEEAPPAAGDLDTGKITLTQDGKSEYAVVIPASDESGEYRLTAEELVRYVKEVSGVTLEIIGDDAPEQTCEITLGVTARAHDDNVDLNALGDEGFSIFQSEQKIAIVGATVRGTLYGVYEFLEDQLGVRFFSTVDFIIPTQKNIVLEPLTENTQTPGFAWRRQSHGGDNLQMRSNTAWSGEPLAIGGDWSYAKRKVCHTFNDLLGTTMHRQQPCLTDEEVYEKMLATALQWLEEDPTAEILSVSQNDGTAQQTGECTCENCLASNELYGSSGTQLNFVNRLAADLSERYPHIMVETLAYLHNEEPPKGGVVPADNVIIRFCTMGGCMLHSLTGEDRSETGVYPGGTNRHYEYLKGWAEITKHLWVWEYDANFGSVFTFTPNFKRLYENVHFYKEIGVEGLFIQGMGETGEFDHLRAYLSSKLLWNPDMSYEEYQELMRTFLQEYYGDGFEDILTIIDRLSDEFNSLHPGMYHDEIRFYPHKKTADGTVDRTLCEEILTLWENAKKQATTVGQKQRVDRSMIPALYYQTTLIGMDIANGKVDVSEMVAVNERIYSIMQREGLTHFKEGGRIPNSPNLKNTILYWGLGGEGIFNPTTESAFLKSQNN